MHRQQGPGGLAPGCRSPSQPPPHCSAPASRAGLLRSGSGPVQPAMPPGGAPARCHAMHPCPLRRAALTECQPCPAWHVQSPFPLQVLPAGQHELDQAAAPALPGRPTTPRRCPVSPGWRWTLRALHHTPVLCRAGALPAGRRRGAASAAGGCWPSAALSTPGASGVRLLPALAWPCWPCWAHAAITARRAQGLPPATAAPGLHLRFGGGCGADEIHHPVPPGGAPLARAPAEWRGGWKSKTGWAASVLDGRPPRLLLPPTPGLPSCRAVGASAAR